MFSCFAQFFTNRKFKILRHDLEKTAWAYACAGMNTGMRIHKDCGPHKGTRNCMPNGTCTYKGHDPWYLAQCLDIDVKYLVIKGGVPIPSYSNYLIFFACQSQLLYAEYVVYCGLFNPN